MRLIKIILVLSLYFVGQLSFAQERKFKFASSGSTSQHQWSEGDSLGNYYSIGLFSTVFSYQDNSVAGSSNGETGKDLYILKANSAGNSIWFKSFRGSTQFDRINFVAAAINNKGELAVVVSTNNVGGITIGERFLPLNNVKDFQVLVKFTKNGFVNWIQVFEAQGQKAGINIKDILLDEQGSVYFTGDFTGEKITFNSTDISGLGIYSRMFVTKYTNTGELAWSNSCVVSNNLPDTTGGITSEKLALDPNGNVFVAGSFDGSREYIFNGQILKCKGASNAYLASYSSTGAIQWAKPYQGSNYIIPGDLSVDNNSGVVFTCFYNTDSMRINGVNYSSLGNFDLLVSKYFSNGQTSWDRPLTTNLAVINENYPQSVVGVGDSSDVYLFGEFISGVVNLYYFLEFDAAAGELEWIDYSSNTASISIDLAKIDLHGNIFISGQTYENFGLGDFLVENITGYGASYLGKVSNNGTVEFLYTRSDNTSMNNLYLSGFSVDIFDNIYVSGTFYGADVNLEQHFLSEKYQKGMFLARYTCTSQIGGNVFNLNGEPITSGQVKLIGYSNFQRSPLSDSVLIDGSGGFLFDEVPNGRYILQAEPGTIEGEEYFPFYFTSEAHWADASRIEIREPSIVNDLEILVSKKPSLDGQATLTGYITEISQSDFKSILSKPSAKAKAKLMRTDPKTDYELIAETETDDNGEFFFENISDGFYTILIEVAGLPVIAPYEVEISGGMYVSNLDYLIEEETIVCNGEPNYNNLDIPGATRTIKVFPNPSHGSLTIAMSEKQIIKEIELTDLQGKNILSLFNVSENISFENINPGVYFLTIKTNSETLIEKIIVKP